MKIELGQDIYDKCKNFANKRIEGSSYLYAYRGESSKNKMIDDCVIGTLGEWAAYYYLKNKGIKVSEPDMNIYPARRKTFNADLFNKELRVHVKSQSDKSFKYYGASWLLQKKDRIVLTPDDDEFFIFVRVSGLIGDVVGSCRVKDIVDNNLWSECKVEKYRHSKVALYLVELQKSGINLNVL